MKSYNHLYEKFISDENIRKAIANSSKGKRDRKDITLYVRGGDKGIDLARYYAEHFRNRNHKPITIYDGISRKQRTIIVPKYDEQIVHHMVVNAMMPIFQKGMYEHSYASIPKRGSHKAKKVIERWIRNSPRDCKYCCQMDIRKFFDSVDHDMLKDRLRKVIHDERFLAVVFEIVNATDKGLPLGFYTSQWFSNWILQDLDHYIKEELRVVKYVRYMDDMVIFGANKRKLHRAREKIAEYLSAHYHLELKDNWQVFRFSYKKGDDDHGRPLDFMGFRFYRSRTTLRRSIMLRITRKAQRLRERARTTILDARQMLSYLGWIKATDTYGMYLKRIKPFVNFQNLKRKVARYDKNHRKETTHVVQLRIA